MDFLIDNLWVLWLIVGAVMLLIEVSTAAYRSGLYLQQSSPLSSHRFGITSLHR